MSERIKTTIRQRVEERNALLERASARLLADPKIVAAWLFGSLGRGEEDDLSDLDIFVVTQDEAIQDYILNRRTNATLGIDDVCLIEAPQNRPPGGAYLMALYPSETGYHEVDWYWQGQSDALIPTDAKLLFDRVGLFESGVPTHFEYQSTEQMKPDEEALNKVGFFWAMLLITTKHIARNPTESESGLLKFVFQILREIEMRFSQESETYLPEHSQPEIKLECLRRFALRMSLLEPQILSQSNFQTQVSQEKSIHLEMTMRFIDLVAPAILGLKETL